MENLEGCFRTLELKPNASPEEVKIAYRELVQVWHPDRFQNNLALRNKAEEKLKSINLAYEQLRAFIESSESWESFNGLTSICS
jgi:curved DNA-binding protein CbpA